MVNLDGQMTLLIYNLCQNSLHGHMSTTKLIRHNYVQYNNNTIVQQRHFFACPSVYYNSAVTHRKDHLLYVILDTDILFLKSMDYLLPNSALLSLCFLLNIKVILQLLSVFPFSYTNACKWRSSLLQNCQDIENSMSKREILMANFISIVLACHLLYTAYKYHVTAVEDVHTETIHYGLDTITVQIIFS